MNDRLAKITHLNNLLNGARAPMTMAKIIERLGYPQPTMERLIRDLREKYQAPIRNSKRHPRGYYYDVKNDERFEFPGIWLDKEELAALFALHSMVKGLPEGIFARKLTALWARLEKFCDAMDIPWSSLEDKVRIIPIGGRKVDDCIFRNVVEALVKQQRLTMVYQPLGKESETREISPLRLILYRDNWSLDAWCHLRDDLRQFALSRMQSAVLAKKKMIPVDRDRQCRFFEESYGIFTGAADKTAIIHFTGIAAEEVAKESWHPEQSQQWLENGTILEMRIPYHKETELIMDVLRWSHEAQVIAPADLRDAITRRIKLMYDIYINK